MAYIGTMKTRKQKPEKRQKASITFRQFIVQFPNDEACLEHLFNNRYGQGHVCPKCDRKSKWFRFKAERAYVCQWCGHHLHPTAGTPFEDTRTPLQLWFYAIYLFTTSRHGVPAKELERQLGVTYKTAWRMADLIRQHIAEVDGEWPLEGDVEMDETVIGGYRPGIRGRGAKGKTLVFGMLERGGQVMTKVVPDVKGTTLIPLIKENIVKGSTCHTDEMATYRMVKQHGYKHETVDHGRKQYVNGNSHTNNLENFWKHFKGAVRSTHIHIPFVADIAESCNFWFTQFTP